MVILGRRALFGLFSAVFAFGGLTAERRALAEQTLEPLKTGRSDPELARWQCINQDCEPYIYDPKLGDPENITNPGHPIPPGIAFQDLPHDWVCPICGFGKTEFIKLST